MPREEEEAHLEEILLTPAVAKLPEAAGVGGKIPRRRIERCVRAWEAEDPSQLNVCEHEFVNVWTETRTEHGWIHAEERGAGAEVGWLPLCVLRQLPVKQYWMQATQTWQAMDESQCSVEDGAVVLVWVNTRTPEGWTYVDAVSEGAGAKSGWLPVFCLAWYGDED